MTKKDTIDGIAYEQVNVDMPKTTSSAKNDCKQAKRAYKLAKSDSRKIIRDARRQRKQAKLAYKASKLMLRAKKYDK